MPSKYIQNKCWKNRKKNIFHTLKEPISVTISLFQQLLANKHHRLRDLIPEHDLAKWRTASRHRHKLRHSNSGREKFGSAHIQNEKINK